MKNSGKSILDTNSFKVYITKIAYFSVPEKKINYSVYVPKTEKREAVETGNNIYYAKISALEAKSGYGKKPMLNGILYLTEQQYNEKPYEKHDKIQIEAGCNLTFDNFSLKDFSKETLKLYPKKEHKQFTDKKTGEIKPYIENLICNIKLNVPIGKHKLFEKKVNAYYFLIDGIKLPVNIAEIEEKIHTFYIDETVYQALLPLHLKTTRVELHSLVKRIKIHEGRVECGLYDGSPFINLIITTKSKEIIAEEKEQRRLEREKTQRIKAERKAVRDANARERQMLQGEKEKQQEKEANVKQKILKVGK